MFVTHCRCSKDGNNISPRCFKLKSKHIYVIYVIYMLYIIYIIYDIYIHIYFKQVLTIFVKDVALPQKHKPLSLVILGSQQSLPIIGFQIKKKGGMDCVYSLFILRVQHSAWTHCSINVCRKNQEKIKRRNGEGRKERKKEEIIL